MYLLNVQAIILQATSKSLKDRRTYIRMEAEKQTNKHMSGGQKTTDFQLCYQLETSFSTLLLSFAVCPLRAYNTTTSFSSSPSNKHSPPALLSFGIKDNRFLGISCLLPVGVFSYFINPAKPAPIIQIHLCSLTHTHRFLLQ